MKWQQDLIKDIRDFNQSDDSDWAYPHPKGYGFYIDEHGNGTYPPEMTYCNRYHLLEQFYRVRDKCSAILEIGIGRNGQDSSYYVFTKNKKKETIYVGLDLDDRSFLDDHDNNVHTIRNNSSSYGENIFKINQLGVKKFDFIFIDGWHSINQILIDWEYTSLLSDEGIVALHDTSSHPGPSRFINNLDQNKWEVLINCCPDDYGIGFAWKK